MTKKKKENTNKAYTLKSNSKWFIANNRLQKNKDIIIILPIIKLWCSKYYFLETGVLTPAFGIAISFLKWNYYFTIQKGY